jgi:hypothetical protein
MRIAVIVTAVAALGLFVAGCAPHATADHAAVDDYCHQCAIYVGDYSRASAAPTVDAETQAAMERMEQAGRHEHMADIAATIVRRARADAKMAFDPATNDLDRQFTRWVKAQQGQDRPWGAKATVGEVAKWIAANRGKLPKSQLLDDELAKM